MRALLILTCTGVSFAHGTNDGQKSIGLIMLFMIGLFPTSFALNLDMQGEDIANVAKQMPASADLIECYGDDQKAIGEEFPFLRTGLVSAFIVSGAHQNRQRSHGQQQRMRWSPRGAHCVATVRAAVLDGPLKRWLIGDARPEDQTLSTPFSHCPKCMIRAGLWDPEKWPDTTKLPSFA